MTNLNNDLKLRPLWLLIGYMLIAYVIYETLTADPVNVDIHLPFADKYMHALGYFILMGWFVQIYHSKKAKLIGALFFIGMGIGLEFLQEMGGVRYFEVADMIANALGVFIALSLSNTVFEKSLLYIDTMIAKKVF